ncbi:hypothetical protein BBK36DRAFT_1169345 [Trichoderma citrinoviride]|uniref:BTB domain-containing protein n=1 Tax=Trichoderma citrinoviride TaxID=58853 RepID=A0A2T4B8I1_9HYPO|nr:hypothetical protein BBK36DRAFT_1169345 [Trichoderma citrinoviride]PTB65635.1 hypothetical protein BBK36DRAFT_1169345 [Trichoderma citrinoviride]
MPTKGGRHPSGPWGRLKPVEQDPLESIGLPSKGDTRLLDLKTQESYYTKIVERYMTFCSDAGQRDELLRRFSSLVISPTNPAPAQASPRMVLPTVTDESLQSPANTKALSDVMAALRKLREGIVATKRADDFAVQAYLFCIRLSMLVKHPESYHPAILHLLRSIHPQQPLTSVELQEVVAYLVLDTACRRGQLAEAYALRKHYALKDTKVNAALTALAHDNYVLFQKVKRSVDGHRAKLMEWAEGDVRMHALKCFGRTYLSVELDFLEKTTGSKWSDLTQRDGVGWDLEGSKVSDDRGSSVLLADYRTAWLLASDEPSAQIICKNETFKVHMSVIKQHSDYFETCMNKPFAEADGVVRFDDIEPRYMAFYLGVAYSYSSIMPHTPPSPSENPEAKALRTPLRDYIEVYKLCDRFLSAQMGDFILKCIRTSIGDGHRALFRSAADKDQQKALMRDFADGYEALEQGHAVQEELAERIIEYFVEGVCYDAWDGYMEEVMNRPKFVAQVSKGFARKLAEALAARHKVKRKELGGP